MRVNRRLAEIPLHRGGGGVFRTGSMTALATPFRRARIDEGALASLVERQARRGAAGVVVCGSTGEAAAMSPAEQARAIAVVCEAVGRSMTVIAGVGAPSTEAACVLARQARRAGAVALLCAPPPYVKPSQDGVFAHIRAVAHHGDLPVIAYDVPGRTGVAIADATLARLFAAGLIVGVKDASADLARVPRLAALCGGDFWQYSGDDGTAAGYRAMGGHGCISVTGNLVPGLCAAMHRAWEGGDSAAFALWRDRLAPLHEALFLETNPVPLKAGLALARLCADRVRLPLVRASVGTVARLRAVLPPLLAAAEEAARVPRLSVVVG